MYRPPFLQPGDKVALVSPAGSIEANYIHDAMEILRTWELHPVTGVHVCEKQGYFAGSDEQRREDMQWALDNEDIRAIFCTREDTAACALLSNWITLLFKAPQMADRLQ